MARRVIHDGPVNSAVMAWMRGQGIKPSDVRGYTLTYDAGDPMRIDIRMYMDDVLPKPANPSFIVDRGGRIWNLDAGAFGYRLKQRSSARSLDYIRERYGIADVQPKHATCIVATRLDGPTSYVCGEECPKPANPPFVVDSNGNVWKYDAPAGGYRFGIGGPGRSLDYIRERYGIADVQPKHATCILTIGPHGPISCVCGDECPKPWPARVRDGEGDEFVHQGDGVYRMVLDRATDAVGPATFTLDEIKREYGIAEE